MLHPRHAVSKTCGLYLVMAAHSNTKCLHVQASTAIGECDRNWEARSHSSDSIAGKGREPKRTCTAYGWGGGPAMSQRRTAEFGGDGLAPAQHEGQQVGELLQDADLVVAASPRRRHQRARRLQRRPARHGRLQREERVARLQHRGCAVASGAARSHRRAGRTSRVSVQGGASVAFQRSHRREDLSVPRRRHNTCRRARHAHTDVWQLVRPA